MSSIPRCIIPHRAGPTSLLLSLTISGRVSSRAAFDYSNLGPKWTFNWLSYVTDDPNGQLPSNGVYLPGGGAEIYRIRFRDTNFP